ncbi:PREDICTED: disease resistance protein RPM1-like [Erythranthe guttata]|nr:PREDICTED: disease resistance protein RPM1-like [Erythranthe guttata]|eukprot:XP_012827292.1 PREDICTED: disease resistance protein RPM1-like [Erythranthe guttata]
MFDIEVSAGYHLHSSFWYLCSKEAAKTKFFYAFNSLAHAIANKGLNYEHRLCIRNNVLLAVEDVQNSIAPTSKVRSLLCTGPSLKYPVPLCLENLRLLRVLDALKIRLYEFPLEVVKLVQLRYLALLYNGNLPPSISKLWNLQHLIVHRYSIVKSVGNLSYLHIEIWNMKDLKFLQTIGRDLPHPCREASLLSNLLTLTGVGPHSCTKDVFEKIPNLKVLLISIELVPDSTKLLSFFDHIFHLHQLDILTCEIKNPILKAEVVTPLAPLSNFPATLTSLTLTGGFGYQWEEISKISSLPNLRLLRLKCYAFRGPKWVVRDGEFQRLEVIVIEDIDLEQWAFQNSSCLPAIRVLRIKHCYKLKKIHLTFGTSLEIIEVLDCNPMVVDWANKLTHDWGDKYGDHKRSVELTIRSSWDGGGIQS